ncbi:hypothetical protein [Paraliomyxa miuraensis]|uniref:hypothetical protein n=1 Tax=Paraliomyxa miuraensis TaxID=376150 RepID=UPI00225A8817|nr:hypothetical protein [Paraliomyxa miuraensis]MCX4246538.1 hypothetical protein [Paraliomyxa miuraensis]
MSLRARGLAACLPGLLACQPLLPELEAEGRRVSVGVQADVELCAGTLRAWDRHVDFVESELGIARDPTDRMEVYIVEDTARWCDDVMACYIGGWVDASFVPSYAPRAIWHELVHHVVSGSDLGMTDRFLSEGVAGTLGDSWCPTPGTDWPHPPLATVLAREEVLYEHYPLAAQFVDFVRQEHGTPALVDLVDCIDRGDPLSTVDECAQRVLHADIGAVDRRFQVATPALHGNPALCSGPSAPWDGRKWRFDAELACSDPDVVNTFGSRYGRETAVIVDLPRAGAYAVELAADGDASVEIEPCFCPTEGSLSSSANQGSVWVGEPGRYRFVFRTADPSASRLRVELWPIDDDEGAQAPT